MNNTDTDTNSTMASTDFTLYVGPEEETTEGITATENTWSLSKPGGSVKACFSRRYLGGIFYIMNNLLTVDL